MLYTTTTYQFSQSIEMDAVVEVQVLFTFRVDTTERRRREKNQFSSALFTLTLQISESGCVFHFAKKHTRQALSQAAAVYMQCVCIQYYYYNN